MSMWTYVHGVIEVDSFESSSEMAMSKVYSVIESLPKITGSERDMQIYVNLLNGYNCSQVNYYGTREWQTKVLISLEGSLRDRSIEYTLKEVTSFLNRLSKRLHIDHCVCVVENGYDKRVDAVKGWDLGANFQFE